MLKFSVKQYELTKGRVNIALGSVLSIWHNYREAGKDDPENAKIPPMDELKAASQHTDINNIVIDEEAKTVYLKDKDMSLDVGAIAKGYAVEVVAKEVEGAGLKSAIISVGGNVRTIGSPPEGKKTWAIGLQDPFSEIQGTQNIVDTVYVNDMSVVTSGDYQRYYEVNGTLYHHIIDPDTLMPANYFKSVSVIYPDSGTADALSTCLFLLPYEEGYSLIESIQGAEALWILKDGSMKYTPGYKEISYKYGK